MFYKFSVEIKDECFCSTAFWKQSKEKDFIPHLEKIQDSFFQLQPRSKKLVTRYKLLRLGSKFFVFNPKLLQSHSNIFVTRCKLLPPLCEIGASWPNFLSPRPNFFETRSDYLSPGCKIPAPRPQAFPVTVY